MTSARTESLTYFLRFAEEATAVFPVKLSDLTVEEADIIEDVLRRHGAKSFNRDGVDGPRICRSLTAKAWRPMTLNEPE